MVDRVVCTCDNCSKHTYLASNGKKAIGRLVSRRVKSDHLNNLLAQRARKAQAKKANGLTTGQKSGSTKHARPIKPNSMPTFQKQPAVAPSIIVPDLDAGAHPLYICARRSDSQNNTQLLHQSILCATYL